MALGTSIQIGLSPSTAHGTITPSGGRSAIWTAIDAGGMDDQDAASITRVSTQITLSTRKWIEIVGPGTIILASLVYDDGLTVSTNPVVKMFGRVDGGAERVVRTKSGALSVTLATAATDAADGTLLRTPFKYDDLSQQWDKLGYSEVIFGVEDALAGTGTTSNAYLEITLI